MVIIEHVRHRAFWTFGVSVNRRTACGRRFVGLDRPTRDTEHHQPQRSRCPECYR